MNAFSRYTPHADMQSDSRFDGVQDGMLKRLHVSFSPSPDAQGIKWHSPPRFPTYAFRRQRSRKRRSFPLAAAHIVPKGKSPPRYAGPDFVGIRIAFGGLYLPPSWSVKKRHTLP
jgi:hypothetical protein